MEEKNPISTLFCSPFSSSSPTLEQLQALTALPSPVASSITSAALSARKAIPPDVEDQLTSSTVPVTKPSSTSAAQTTTLPKWIKTSTLLKGLKLIEIATGIARGINYLHRGCEMQILHFVIKPHNILLDRNFNPKIVDFGLTKLYPRNKALVSISVARGTIGYIAPELISRSFGVISYKADVYSFGMLLLEMAGKRRNVNPHIENSSQVYYPSWIYDKLSQLDEAQLENTFEIESLEKKLALIGLWCIQTKSYDRPTMSRVLEMLETDVESTIATP